MWDTSKDRRLTEYTSQGSRRLTSVKDVTFDKDSTYIKSRKRAAEEPEETEAPKIHDTTMNEEIQEEDRELEECQETRENNPHKRKPARVQEAIQGAERYGPLEEIHRERKRTRSCPVM